MIEKIYSSPLDRPENIACLMLGCFGRVGPRRFLKAKEYFKGIAGIMLADKLSLEQAGWPAASAEEFISFRKSFSLSLVVEALNNEGAGFISIEDDFYPNCLREIFDPPFIIFYRGDLNCFKLLKHSLAVVGSRRASLYGQRAIESLIGPLSSFGVMTISGLACGIDAWAHECALDNRMVSIGVIGSGIAWDDFYPRENLTLAKRLIAEKGLILSEFFIGTPPFKANFPRRNRIIAALAPAVLVIEAGQKSGALITAKHALDLGKDVLSVPGSIFSENFRGCHYLLKNGAALVESAEDVLEVLNFDNIPLNFKENNCSKSLNDGDNNDDCSIFGSDEDVVLENKILTALRDFPLSVEGVILATGLDIRLINSTLSILEIKGSIRKNNISQYFLR